MSTGVVEHPAAVHQAMLGRLAFLNTGAGVARVRIYGGTRRASILDAVGADLIVELPLLSPPATVVDAVMTLRPGAPGLNLITDTAVWAVVVNANGDTAFDCDASASGGAGQVWVSAGGGAGTTLFAGGETTLASGVMG